VTGVDSGDFALASGGSVSGAAIGPVTGSGAIWTVTADTGTGDGTLGLHLIDNETITDAASNPLGGTGPGNGDFTGEIYTIDRAATTTCFTDDFNRADGAPAGNWIVANEGGSFGNPRIVNGRLRLTDASEAVSTMAALQQLFPAAGNKIVVELDHFAYNGSGADGIGVTLSDASAAPVPGAFGGSLGYAPKQESAGGDTTHPGFAGGWLGVALDEWGNFSANTEGRSGGAAPGQRADSVAVRGSGSGYTGYAYLGGTETLSPGIDNAGSTSPAPGYRYRIIIDHLDGVHAWTSVERNTGSGFVFLIEPFDAKAAAGQAEVPVNWFLSLTGSTGAATNIHEIDNLEVCSAQPQPLPTLDHVRLQHDGSATTCGPENITLRACGDADCSTLYLSPVTVDLNNIQASTWSSDPATFSGEDALTLDRNQAGTVTLGGTVTSPSENSPPVICFNGGTQGDCTLTYTQPTACFDAVEVGQPWATPIFTKLADVGFSLDVLAPANFNNKTVSVALVDPDVGSGNCGDTNPGLTGETSYTFTPGDNSRRTFPFNYPNAVPNVRVRIINASTNQPVCSSDNFAIRPQQFTLSTTDPLSPASDTHVAGADFALTAAPGVTGYNGTPTVQTTLIIDHNNTLIGAGTFTGDFPPAAGGATTGTFQYLEVGTITLPADTVIDATFTDVDRVKGECTTGSTANTPVGVVYGCTIGSGALGPLGRFIPDHFTITPGTVTPGCGSFTYFGQDFSTSFTLTAENSANGITTKYTAGYAPLLDLTDWDNFAFTTDDLPPGSLSAGISAPTGSWIDGVATVTAWHQASRPASPVPQAAITVSAQPVDPDGVTTASPVDLTSGGVDMRWGRIILQNAYGPETQALTMPLLAQYHDGSSFVLNPDDTCSLYDADDLTCDDDLSPADDLACSNVTASGTGVGHAQAFTLTEPDNGKTGPLRYTLAVDAWLRYDWANDGSPDEDPAATANFGLYRGNDRIINWREIIR
jgi:MSHA biogenesis protein MshQ